MAKLHLAGASYQAQSKNQRDDAWRNHTAAQVIKFLNPDDQALLNETLKMQANFNRLQLPHGVIHADMFRDNVLFDGDKLGGIIDFYYACHDVLLYDIAIAVNDWCIEENGSIDKTRANALLKSYNSLRPLTPQEHEAWPSMLSIAALRFWLSRLYDFYYPQEGELTHAKDPNYFRKILRDHHAQQSNLKSIWVT
jgi:homoserine kinase type II